MPNRALNNLGLNTDWDLGEDGWKAGMDYNLLVLDTLVQGRVLDIGVDDPPSSPVAGAAYLVGPNPTGDWLGSANAIAVYDEGAWTLVGPLEGWEMHNLADGRRYKFDGANWLPTAPLNNPSATADPGATDDSTAGYQPLSRWLNTSTGEFWVCVDATASAASWQKTTLTLDELGSAALANVGLGGADVPSNGDLGSAAYADKTTSATDTTAGRLLQVGAFGLGAPVSAPDIADLNTANTFGSYSSESGIPNTPVTGGGTTLTGARNPNAGFQFYNQASSGGAHDLWFRSYGAGIFGPWAKILTQRTILGTVSQSGGVPTGAVIERGSNANGEYVKFADGTLWCRHHQKALYDVASRLLCQWNFPVAFASPSAYSWSAEMQERDPNNVNDMPPGISSLIHSQVSEGSHSATLLNVNVRAATGEFAFSTGDYIWMSLTAIGRWY